MKKSLAFALAITLTAVLVSAQTSTWNQDFKKAMALSQKTGKPVLIDFSGTDWCSWCIKLDKEVFSKRAFKQYAKKDLILMLAAFPKWAPLAADLKAQNEELAQKFSVEGFPTVVLLNSKGETIGRTGYQPGGPEKYVQHLKEIIGGSK